MNSQFDLQKKSRLSGLKTQLRERLANNRPLTKQIQEERDRVNERSNYWGQEIKKNWFIYFLLGISALFTGMLGLFMGLAPTLQLDPASGNNVIHFNDDAGHVFTALLYIVAFITITEGAFVVGKWKFHTREEGNNKQTSMMIFVMVLAFVSILGTGWAGGTVVASTLGFLTEFKEIPTWAQEWAVRIIPLLFGLYTVFFTIYWLSSDSAKMERIATQERNAQRADHRFTMEMLELQLEEEALEAEADALIALVRSGKISHAQYTAARRAKMSIPQLEEHLGQDLNDDNKIANRPILNAPAELPWKCEHCSTQNNAQARFCQGCGAPVGSSPVLRPAPQPRYHPVLDEVRSDNGAKPDPTQPPR